MYILNKIPDIFNICIYFFTVLCRASSFHWSILNHEIHLSVWLHGMVLVYGMADSCLYNKQNNTWTLGDMDAWRYGMLIAALTRSISMWTLEDKFHIFVRPCIILYVLHKNSPCWSWINIVAYKYTLLNFATNGQPYLTDYPYGPLTDRI